MEKLTNELKISEQELSKLKEDLTTKTSQDKALIMSLQQEIASAQGLSDELAEQRKTFETSIGSIRLKLKAAHVENTELSDKLEAECVRNRNFEGRSRDFESKIQASRQQAEAEIELAIQQEKQNGLQREQEYMNEYFDKRREAEQLAVEKMRLKTDHERMQKRLAIALADAENVRLKELRSLTERAVNITSVSIEDSDVAILQAELRDCRESLEKEREVNIISAKEREQKSEKLFSSQAQNFKNSTKIHVAQLEKAQQENLEMQLALQKAHNQVRSVLFRDFFYKMLLDAVCTISLEWYTAN